MRQEKGNSLRMKPARCRAETIAVAASRGGLKLHNPFHTSGHDKCNALQAEKGDVQSKLGQCQADKEKVTVHIDELQAARTELAAQLATTEAKVGPFKDVCASHRFDSVYGCRVTCSIGTMQQCSLNGSISAEAGRTMPETCSPQVAADTKLLQVSSRAGQH